MKWAEVQRNQCRGLPFCFTQEWDEIYRKIKGYKDMKPPKFCTEDSPEVFHTKCLLSFEKRIHHKISLYCPVDEEKQLEDSL